MSERDELAQVIHSRICEESLSDCLEYRDRCVKAAESATAAGYRKPRTVTTVDELDALPGETVVRDLSGMIYELDYIVNDPANKWWIKTGTDTHSTNGRIDLPATVLYTPEPLS